MKTGHFLAMLVLGWVASSTLLAQEVGRINGHVETEQGDPIAQASVTVSNEKLNTSKETATTSQGIYMFSQLPAGLYRLETHPQGYNRQITEGIQVHQGTTIEVDLRLGTVQKIPTIQAVEGRGEKERNPNIFIAKIDLNALRDPLRRRGIKPVSLEFSAVKNFYGADFGAPLRQILVVQPGELHPALHGSLYEMHQNSALNARPFFNVGRLRPSHRNQFGFSLSAELLQNKLFLSSSLDLVRESGLVNGNIRVPLPKERIPAAGDPQTNEIIAGLLQAFPQEAPNLPGVTARQLNTNAERDIRSEDWTLKLDYLVRSRDHLAFQYAITDFEEDPFEFVAGQNPKTDLRPQTFSATHVHNWSPETVLQSSFHFDRLSAQLVPTERFRSLLEPLGLRQVPDIIFGSSGFLSRVGPGPRFPRERFQNRFSGQVNFTQSRTRHHLRTGAQLTRVQLNDLQNDSSRGRFIFSNNFGRTAIENFLHGTPSRFTITLGELYRGFRHWESSLYVQDTYQAEPGLTLTLGLRYEVVTAPSEINNLTPIAFGDSHNWAPQVGFAWNPRNSPMTVRGGYGISFGQIFPGTFQLARFNPPAVRTITLQKPTLVNPLRNLQVMPGAPQRSELSLLSPDLVPPYSHQFNFRIETRLPGRLLLQIGYIGNRTLKLFFPLISNRAEPTPGIEATTATIDSRRPDPRFFSVKTIINSGRSYYDALKVVLRRRLARGLGFDVTYLFSKDLTSGSDFATTLNGSGRVTSQNNRDFQGDLRGPTVFDRRHVFTVDYTYELPFKVSGRRFPASLLGGWTISGVTVFQTGAPFDLGTGSDAPGFGNVDGQRGDRPNITNPSILGKAVDDPDTSTSILNPAFFNTDIPVGGRGNVGLRVFRKDALSNTNLALTKSFPWAGDKPLEFRAEFDNFFNHPWFKAPGDVFPSPVFGKIIDTQNKGRVIQFMLKLTF